MASIPFSRLCTACCFSGVVLHCQTFLVFLALLGLLPLPSLDSVCSSDFPRFDRQACLRTLLFPHSPFKHAAEALSGKCLQSFSLRRFKMSVMFNGWEGVKPRVALLLYSLKLNFFSKLYFLKSACWVSAPLNRTFYYVLWLCPAVTLLQELESGKMSAIGSTNIWGSRTLYFVIATTKLTNTVTENSLDSYRL